MTCERSNVLKCYIVSAGKYLPVFRRIVLSSFSDVSRIHNTHVKDEKCISVATENPQTSRPLGRYLLKIEG
jgi:hypothetical protein